MARFKGEIYGAGKTGASRLGHKNLTTRCNGRNIGVECYAFDHEGEDYIQVYVTSGSNGGDSQFLAYAHKDKDGNIIIERDEDTIYD